MDYWAAYRFISGIYESMIMSLCKDSIMISRPILQAATNGLYLFYGYGFCLPLYKAHFVWYWKFWAFNYIGHLDPRHMVFYFLLGPIVRLVWNSLVNMASNKAPIASSVSFLQLLGPVPISYLPPHFQLGVDWKKKNQIFFFRICYHFFKANYTFSSYFSPGLQCPLWFFKTHDWPFLQF